MPLATKILALFILALAVLWAVVQYRARMHEAQAETTHPPEGRLIEVDGHTVHAVVMGEGPDVVLIHGSSGNTRDTTLSLAPRLAREFRVFIIDRPGLGYTDRINTSGATITQQADLLSAAAAKLGAEDPIVVGHSYGGAVALAWAVHHPQEMSALVTLSAASHPWSTGLSTYYKLLSHPVAGPLVIGVGVNVNNPPPAGELVIPATSVADLAERPVDLETFTTGLVERVVQTIDSYAADPSDAWLDAINDRLAYRDQVVTLSAEGRADEVGSVRRVAPDGSLVVEVDGAERAVMSGAVSLRACATENGVVR